jgi:D-sedoheptulose 7-phosphate isomerase
VTFSTVTALLNRIPEADIRRAVSIVLDARRTGNRLFFIGNGGSSAIASHMAADFLKNGHMAAQCFTDGALVTCLANDLGYLHAYSKPLSMFAKANDVLFAISSSGQSANILEAANVARVNGLSLITLSGFQPDNRLRSMGDVNFYVDSNRYGHVEVVHHAVCHAILDTVIHDP